MTPIHNQFLNLGSVDGPQGDESRQAVLHEGRGRRAAYRRRRAQTRVRDKSGSFSRPFLDGGRLWDLVVTLQ